jgi:hypothetical protein
LENDPEKSLIAGENKRNRQPWNSINGPHRLLALIRRHLG